MSDTTVTISLTLPVGRAIALLNSLQSSQTHVSVSPPTSPRIPEAESGVEIFKPQTTRFPTDLKYLLDGRSAKLVRFFVDHHGEGFNADLAEVMDVEPAATSAILGKVTLKLRKVNIDSNNWYSKYRRGGKTYLKLRPDILEVFRKASGAEK